MPLLQDIGTVLGHVGNNLVGNLGEEFRKAKEESFASGGLQPLIVFYNENEKELAARGLSINDLLNIDASALEEYGVQPKDVPTEKVTVEGGGTIKDFVLPILGIVAGGAAVLILIKTLKK